MLIFYITLIIEMKEYKYIYIVIIILITLSIIYATDYFKLKGLFHEYKINNNLFQIVTPEYLNTVNTENCKDILDLFEVDYIVDKRYKKNYITLSVATTCFTIKNSTLKKLVNKYSLYLFLNF
jgi:hypothetical protein